MSTDITHLSAARAPTSLQTTTTRAATNAASHADGQPTKSVAMPEKPQINFDPAAAQRHVEEAVERLNEQMKKGSYNLNFTVDASTDQVVVKVRNTQTGDVIRQIPNEAALRFAHNLDDLKGMLNDEKT